MTEAQIKYPFVSPAWVEIAQGVLEELVAENATAETKFSICESFAEAPKTFADENGFASWHFYIDGKTLRVGLGRADDVDVNIQATWKLALPNVKLVYTPEILAERAKNPPKRPPDPHEKVTGDMSGAPTWLAALHNRMAVITE